MSKKHFFLIFLFCCFSVYGKAQMDSTETTPLLEPPLQIGDSLLMSDTLFGAFGTPSEIVNNEDTSATENYYIKYLDVQATPFVDTINYSSELELILFSTHFTINDPENFGSVQLELALLTENNLSVIQYLVFNFSDLQANGFLSGNNVVIPFEPTEDNSPYLVSVLVSSSNGNYDRVLTKTFSL